jgi:hypothetical protein
MATAKYVDVKNYVCGIFENNFISITKFRMKERVIRIRGMSHRNTMCNFVSRCLSIPHVDKTNIKNK